MLEEPCHPWLHALLVVWGCRDWKLLLQTVSHGAPPEEPNTVSQEGESGCGTKCNIYCWYYSQMGKYLYYTNTSRKIEQKKSRLCTHAGHKMSAKDVRANKYKRNSVSLTTRLSLVCIYPSANHCKLIAPLIMWASQSSGIPSAISGFVYMKLPRAKLD